MSFSASNQQRQQQQQLTKSKLPSNQNIIDSQQEKIVILKVPSAKLVEMGQSSEIICSYYTHPISALQELMHSHPALATKLKAIKTGIYVAEARNKEIIEQNEQKILKLEYGVREQADKMAKQALDGERAIDEIMIATEKVAAETESLFQTRLRESRMAMQEIVTRLEDELKSSKMKLAKSTTLIENLTRSDGLRRRELDSLNTKLNSLKKHLPEYHATSLDREIETERKKDLEDEITSLKRKIEGMVAAAKSFSASMEDGQDFQICKKCRIE